MCSSRLCAVFIIINDLPFNIDSKFIIFHDNTAIYTSGNDDHDSRNTAIQKRPTRRFEQNSRNKFYLGNVPLNEIKPVTLWFYIDSKVIDQSEQIY